MFTKDGHKVGGECDNVGDVFERRPTPNVHFHPACLLSKPHSRSLPSVLARTNTFRRLEKTIATSVHNTVVSCDYTTLGEICTRKSNQSQPVTEVAPSRGLNKELTSMTALEALVKKSGGEANGRDKVSGVYKQAGRNLATSGHPDQTPLELADMRQP